MHWKVWEASCSEVYLRAKESEDGVSWMYDCERSRDCIAVVNRHSARKQKSVTYLRFQFVISSSLLPTIIKAVQAVPWLSS